MKSEWHDGKPLDDRPVLALAQEAGLNDDKLTNVFGFVIARWFAWAHEWRSVDLPSLTGRQRKINVKYWCELPAAPSGIKPYLA